MKNIKICEYSEGQELFEYIKLQDLMDKEFYSASQLSSNSLDEVMLKRRLFEAQLIAYKEESNKEIKRICVFACPGMMEKNSILNIILCNMDNVDFLKIVLDDLKKDFDYCEWTKIRISFLEYQLTDAIRKLLEIIGFEKEYTIPNINNQFMLINYCYWLKKDKNL